MKRLYFIGIFLTIFNLVSSCSTKSSNQDLKTNEITQDEDKINKSKDSLSILYDSIGVQIFKIPEIRALDKNLKVSTQGKKGAVIINDDENFVDSTYFYIKVGEMSEYSYHTIYRFEIDRRSLDIYAIWGDEELYSLPDWSKINGVHKDYGSPKDSLEYIYYLTNHYKNIPDELLNKKEENTTSKNDNSTKDIKYSILPFDFEEYYKSCIYPSDEKECSIKYQTYSYNPNDSISKIIGKKYYPSKYIFLPSFESYSPIILCNTESDMESYDLIILYKKKMISYLQIGLMDGNNILDFNISNDYKISLYKRKSMNDLRRLFKTYIISSEGRLIEK